MSIRHLTACLGYLILLVGAVGERNAVGIDELKLGESDLLTIGSTAPELDIEHWVYDGEGRFKHIKRFVPGKVYVVEFWATWCGPCVASMPHLAALQKEFADKGVQIISVSDEDLETIREFLTRNVPAQDEDLEASKEKNGKPRTFADLCKVYCLTTDPDGSTGRDYMEASRQNGIPTSFIVGKDAKIEWIGHPMEIDEPLKAVIADKWDRKKFADELRAQKEMEMTVQRISLALRRSDYDQAIELIDKVLATLKSPQQKLQLQNTKLQALVSKGDVAAATTHLKSVLDSLAEDLEMINVFTWSVYELSESAEVDKTILGVAASVAEKSADKTEKGLKGSLLDTAAHLYHKRGELDKALALEAKAISLASDQDRQFFTQFLKQLEEEKSSKK